MSRRKPIDAKILEAAKMFDACIFAETVKGTFSDFPDYRRNQKRVLYPVVSISCSSLWLFLRMQYDQRNC